ncbi:methyltransferase [Roseococcus sp. YIM B11640]|uniref:methyltransferase n=1 Tax=Roseococcus sp. YIM B11640 TaxID=3133973 RepID=UPI003C7A5A79
MAHPDTAPAAPTEILQLGMAFWGSKALLSAVELGVFTLLGAEGPARLPMLAARLGLHERGARDFLDALVALGMLTRDEEGRYANTPQTATFLDRARPEYIGGLLEMANRRLYPFWGRLTDALRSGEPQNEARDGEEDLFGAIYRDPATLEIFLQAMTGVSLPTAHSVAQAFPWTGRRSFADIGCAQGGLAVTVARAHPHLRGIGFDLPAVGPVFEAYVAKAGLSGRIRFEPGDFFSGALPNAEVLVMGHILHDWPLDDKRMLLRKAHAALPPGGALIVYDAMIDDERRTNAFGLLMSLNMLIETRGGFDYTGADCIGWAREAGFAEAAIQPLQGPYSMMVAQKAG